MKILFVAITLALFCAGCATAAPSEGRETMISPRTGVRISFVRPRGWEGAAFRSLPSYEEWGLELKDNRSEEQKSHLSFRIDPPTTPAPWPRGATDESVAAYWSGFRNPVATTFARAEVAGQMLLLRRVQNIDGDLIVADHADFEGQRISFTLWLGRNEDFNRLKTVFVRFMQSVRISR